MMQGNGRGQRWGVAIVLAIGMTSTAASHPPDPSNHPVRPRYDLIPPLGNNLDAGYRRTYNRPRRLLGRLAWKFNPTSQEAMSWHAAEHRGDYDCNRGRTVPMYNYLKPWQAIRVGQRPAPYDPDAAIEAADPTIPESTELLDAPPEIEPEPLEDLIEPSIDGVDDKEVERELMDELALPQPEDYSRE